MIDGEVYKILKQIAKAQKTIFYSDIPRNREEIGAILDKINEYEHSENRPMLSAVVVSKDSRQPSGGFYICADGLKVRRAGETNHELWVRQLKDVFNEWK